MNLRDHQAGQFYLDNWTAETNKDGSNPNGSNEGEFDPDEPSMTRANFALKFHFKRNLTR